MNNRNRGFTLLELLIVCAIIAVLVVIVIAALNQARAKGSTTSVKSNMHTIANQAALYYTQNGNFGLNLSNTCLTGVFSDPVIQQALIQIAVQDQGTSLVCNRFPLPTPSQNWAVSTTLKTGGTWCVDATSHKGPGIATGGVCI